VIPESLVTVRCRECREWLCVPPPDHPPADPLPYPKVAGRILGWCYCATCLVVRDPPVRTVKPDDGGGPAAENAVRDMEDAGG
jgi:hypothetical protein